MIQLALQPALIAVPFVMAAFMQQLPLRAGALDSSPQGLRSFYFSGFIFKGIAYISKPFMFLCSIPLLHLAFATPSNLDSSGTNPATASAILKQMLQTMPLHLAQGGESQEPSNPPALHSSASNPILSPNPRPRGDGRGFRCSTHPRGSGHGMLPVHPSQQNPSSFSGCLLPLLCACSCFHPSPPSPKG